MRLIFSLVALWMPLVSWPESNCDFGTPHADAPAETQQFDFLIGRHEITLHAWTQNGWTPPRPINAQWNGWYGLQGRAIYDEWLDPDPNQGGLGVNVRIYDPQEKIWKMMWVATSGLQVQDLRAKMIDDKMTMWQVYPPRDKWKAEFNQLASNQWERISYQQDAEGTWQPQFRLVARRAPCG